MAKLKPGFSHTALFAVSAASLALGDFFDFFAVLKIPCSKLQGIVDRKECGLFYDPLAFAVQSLNAPVSIHSFFSSDHQSTANPFKIYS